MSTYISIYMYRVDAHSFTAVGHKILPHERKRLTREFLRRLHYYSDLIFVHSSWTSMLAGHTDGLVVE